jgi:hypothetical protein
MLKDEIDFFLNEPKKIQSQPMLTFETTLVMSPSLTL